MATVREISKENVDLYVTSVDLTGTLDAVSRECLCKIMAKSEAST